MLGGGGDVLLLTPADLAPTPALLRILPGDGVAHRQIGMKIV